MNKYKWDTKKLMDAKKKLNVNNFKSIEEFEEVSDLYNLLISTYIKDTFEEYIEYDDFKKEIIKSLEKATNNDIKNNILDKVSRKS